MSISVRTRAKALDALNGMAQIVKNEMLVRNQYATAHVVNPELAGSLCGGYKYCAIGSLWVGYGVKVDGARRGVLPGVQDYERGEFFRTRPGLSLAYDALNASADTFIERHGVDLDAACIEIDFGGFSSSLEALFEGDGGGDVVDRKALLGIINSAKRKVRAA
jgi:hypothetical protein